MLLSDFDYDLPDELIAKYPAERRSDSRLLVVGAQFEDRRIAELPSLLHEGDLLVFNDTRVIRARLRGTKETGGRVEILVERIGEGRDVLAQVRASKSPRSGMRIDLPGGQAAVVGDRSDDLFMLQFSCDPYAYLERFGEVPLPPYLGRGEASGDGERYQTVYAREPGAVAAPTAGLHFDEALLTETRDKGIQHAFVTLHVGAGTFQPLRNDELAMNRLHAERLTVSDDVAGKVRETQASGGRIIAVGTTSVRALEAASGRGTIEPIDGETDLFIMPGYEFRSVDAMLTNFHLPQSSLLVLVAAFAGRERVLDAYRHAVDQRYRFFSYGDAMLLFPEPS